MERLSKTILLSLLCLLFSACSNVPLARELPTPVVTPALTAQVITAESVVRLTEVTRLAVDNAGPVAALTFTPDAQTLLVAHAQEGMLRQWRLADRALLHTLDVHPVELGAADFDVAGKLLATGAGAEWELHKADSEYLDFRIWDVQTGKMLQRENKYALQFGVRAFTPSIQLSPDGRWALMVSAIDDSDLTSLKDLFAYEVATGRPGGAFVNFSRKPEEDDFDVIAFDAQGGLFAAADESGKVAIFLFHPPDYPKEAQAIIEKPGPLGPRPLALAFDPRRRWLAGIRGTELIVWDLQSSRYERQLEASVGDGSGLTASLAFDPSSTLLGVGTVNGWQIWNVKDKQLVAEGTGIEVYAVTFSPDGRLFAWGDVGGVVHLWGVPEK